MLKSISNEQRATSRWDLQRSMGWMQVKEGNQSTYLSTLKTQKTMRIWMKQTSSKTIIKILLSSFITSCVLLILNRNILQSSTANRGEWESEIQTSKWVNRWVFRATRTEDSSIVTNQGLWYRSLKKFEVHYKDHYCSRESVLAGGRAQSQGWLKWKIRCGLWTETRSRRIISCQDWWSASQCRLRVDTSSLLSSMGDLRLSSWWLRCIRETKRLSYSRNALQRPS